jgi:hypothetical protein
MHSKWHGPLQAHPDTRASQLNYPSRRYPQVLRTSLLSDIRLTQMVSTSELPVLPRICLTITRRPSSWQCPLCRHESSKPHAGMHETHVRACTHTHTHARARLPARPPAHTHARAHVRAQTCTGTRTRTRTPIVAWLQNTGSRGKSTRGFH